MSTSRCLVENCKTTLHAKQPGVHLHSCPTSLEMRNKWMKMLKNKCHMLDWKKSRICSKHFEQKYFDSQRMLIKTAVPTIFRSSQRSDGPVKCKVERLITKLSQSELTSDVKYSLSRLKAPTNLDAFVLDNLQCKSDAPMEAKLWLMVKKQDNLISRLMDLVVQTKRHVEVLQNSTEETRSSKKECEQNIESLKYVVACLQEKHASLEEQIEILTAVESR